MASSEQKKHVQRLLKLTRKQLIKQCKKSKLSCEGSKLDMIDRIIKHQNNDISSSISSIKLNTTNKVNIKKTYSLLSSFSCKLVVNGYIRNIQTVIAKQLIPIDVILIILHYLMISNIFIKITHGKYVNRICHNLHIKIGHFQQNSLNNYASKIIRYQEPKIKNLTNKRVEHKYKWDMGICQASNVELPPKITEQISLKKYKYDVIFICGGNIKSHEYKECNAYIIDKQYEYIYHWELPPLLENVRNNCVVYNENYGLFSVGGLKNGYGDSYYAQNTVYCLPFDDLYKKQHLKSKTWKWKEVATCYMRNDMNVDRQGCCAGIIQSKLFVIGGSKSRSYTPEYAMNRALKSVEMLDLNGCYDCYGRIKTLKSFTKLSTMNYKRFKPGICCDMKSDMIYVAGGNEQNCNVIERYDITKNIWIIVGEACKCYQINPILWINND
eukprot:435526_1